MNNSLSICQAKYNWELIIITHHLSLNSQYTIISIHTNLLVTTTIHCFASNGTLNLNQHIDLRSCSQFPIYFTGKFFFFHFMLFLFLSHLIMAFSFLSFPVGLNQFEKKSRTVPSCDWSKKFRFSSLLFSSLTLMHNRHQPRHINSYSYGNLFLERFAFVWNAIFG